MIENIIYTILHVLFILYYVINIIETNTFFQENRKTNYYFPHIFLIVYFTENFKQALFWVKIEIEKQRKKIQNMCKYFNELWTKITLLSVYYNSFLIKSQINTFLL